MDRSGLCAGLERWRSFLRGIASPEEELCPSAIRRIREPSAIHSMGMGHDPAGSGMPEGFCPRWHRDYARCDYISPGDRNVIKAFWGVSIRWVYPPPPCSPQQFRRLCMHQHLSPESALPVQRRSRFRSRRRPVSPSPVSTDTGQASYALPPAELQDHYSICGFVHQSQRQDLCAVPHGCPCRGLDRKRPQDRQGQKARDRTSMGGAWRL